MLCPVCKTECASNVCTKCGFTEVGKEFINREEAEQWFNDIVIPYRNNYQKENILPPINWMEVFKQNPQAKHLLEFSIPVAIKRRINVDALKSPQDADYYECLKDATLGHIAIVSSNDMLRKHLLDVIDNAYFATTSFKITSSAAIERASDLAAIVSALQPGEVLVLEMNSKMKKDVVKVFSTALSDFGLDIIIGKGQGARSIYIDLAPFTAVFLAEKIGDIPTEIVNNLDAVIEINPTQDEMTELQIREMAPLYDIQLTKGTIEGIKECIAQNSFKNIKSILKYLSDYLYLHTELRQPLSAETVREITTNIN